ncbi:hypothetical protein PQQ87_08275 [Paraburkholderia nemoris]|uniref:hypothetical protein n=1 Tax=Paraburkholderia nemoris TaxID=2793076 RepID=UPI0038BC5EE3
MRMRYVAAAAVAVVAVIGIASCNSHHDEYAAAPVAAPVVQAAPTQTPVIVQQPPVVVQQPSNDGFWQGYMMAHLFGGWGHTTVVHHYSPAPVVRNTTIINKTVNVTRPAPAPVYRAPVTTYRPPVSTGYSAYRSSSSYSGYRSSSSSFRSSGYSSFRSGRR